MAAVTVTVPPCQKQTDAEDHDAPGDSTLKAVAGIVERQEVKVSVSVLDMSVSLDGYIADPNDFLGGDDGERLHKWADADGGSDQPSGPVQQFQDEWNAAGAVLAGRRTAELMDHWGGDHGGLPIFVPSHRPPGPAARWAIRW